MARTEARITAAIWGADDWRELSPDGQWMYLALLTQPDLSACGMIVLRPRVWAKLAKGLTAARVSRAVRELASSRMVLIDADTDELLIRTFIRHNVVRSPNLLKAAARSFAAIHSPAIREGVRRQLPPAVSTRFPDSILGLSPKHIGQLLAEPFEEPLAEGLPEPLPEPNEEPLPEGCARSLADSGERIADNDVAEADASPTHNPEIVKLCEHLAERVGQHTASPAPKSDTTRWRNEMRLLVERGPTEWADHPRKIPPDEVARLVDAIFDRLNVTNNGGFCWANQIQSPANLRKHWLKLTLAARKSTNGHQADPERAAARQRALTKFSNAARTREAAS